MGLGELKIPKQPNKALLYALFVLVLFEEFLISMFHLPGAIRYLNDGIVLALFVCVLPAASACLQKSGFGAVILMMLLFSVSLLMGTIMGNVPPLHVLWALRNTFRFFAFFVICICLLNKEDVLLLLNHICSLQWLNLILCLFEYFVLHKKQDHLGGIFGIAVGCNSYLNVYLCLVLTYTICCYMSKKCSGLYLAASLLSAMLIAGLSELKILFLEIVLIVMLTLFFYRPSKKALRIVYSSAVAIILGLIILRKLFPAHFDVLTSLDNITKYINQEDGGYHLSRFHAFENINRLFFKGDLFQNLFGRGFGSAEYSNYSFLTSQFYRQYGKYNYRWFAHQMLFIETGYVGLVLYITILATSVVCCIKKRKVLADNKEICYMSIIMALLTIVNLWYNAAIRAESAYLIYFSLAAAPICVLSAGRNNHPAC